MTRQLSTAKPRAHAHCHVIRSSPRRVVRRLLWRTLTACFLLMLSLCAVPHLRAASTESFWVHRQPAQVRTATSQQRASTRKTLPATRPTPPTNASQANAQSTDGSGPGHNRGTSAPTDQRSISEALAIGNSSPWAVVTGLTLLTILPAIVLAMTPLVRLLVVFHFLRQASAPRPHRPTRSSWDLLS